MRFSALRISLATVCFYFVKIHTNSDLLVHVELLVDNLWNLNCNCVTFVSSQYYSRAKPTRAIIIYFIAQLQYLSQERLESHIYRCIMHSTSRIIDKEMFELYT